jgi:N-acetylneuraminic acid mutarotase
MRVEQLRSSLSIFGDRSVRLIAAGLFFVLLPSCGGGGGSMPPNVPNVIVQPTSVTAAQNGSVNFTIGVSGNGTLSYEWRHNGTAVGTNSATLKLTDIQLDAAGSYDCVITNTIGGASQTATSQAATLTVAQLPSISTQPMTSTLAQGSSVTLTVAASANGTLSYQWNLNGTAVNGATSPTLTLQNLQPNENGAYTCAVTNTLNGVAATTSSVAATLTVLAPPPIPTITSPAAVIAGQLGSVAAISAQAGVTYVWTISNGAITSGQGSNQVTFTAGAQGNVTLDVTVTNQVGESASNVFVVRAFNSLPIASIFTQNPVLYGTSNIVASTPGATGQRYAWTFTSGTATGAISGSSAAQTLDYFVGAAPGSYQLAVQVTDSSGRIGNDLQSFQVVSQTFIQDPRDLGERSSHTATPLSDGRVLVAGGATAALDDGSLVDPLAAARVYDPTTNIWAAVGPMSTPRAGHTATLLNDGRVLVTGGISTTSEDQESTPALASAEIYDPATRSWSLAGSMAAARTGHTATLLSDGRVLITGGTDGAPTLTANPYPTTLNSAEIYDPATNLFTPTAPMNSARAGHTAVALLDGRVLVAGGNENDITSLNSAEIYDPTAATWTLVAPMSAARAGYAAILLPSGKVLELGGTGEVYDPVANSWSTSNGPPMIGNPTAQHDYVTATLLPSGSVLATGASIISAFESSTAVEIYDPATNSWGPVLNLAESRAGPTATLLATGNILVAAGVSPCGTLADAELFNPVSGTSTIVGSRTGGGGGATTSTLSDGSVLAAGGQLVCSANLTTVAATYLFNPSTNLWTPTGPLPTPVYDHTATVLADGSVLVAGGSNFGPVATSQIFSPAAGQWTVAGNMVVARAAHTASLLSSGQVLVAGGSTTLGENSFNGSTSAAELFNPSTSSWKATAPMAASRVGHTATVLGNGQVLVAGGESDDPILGNSTPLASAELYDPTSGTWSPAASMNEIHDGATAALLPSGSVLVAGGGSASAELYNPTTNSWSYAAPMSTSRTGAAAVVLANGTPLVVGGYTDQNGDLTTSAEAYDPATNTWSPAGNLVVPENGFALGVLQDGRVLVYGGGIFGPGAPEFYK